MLNPLGMLHNNMTIENWKGIIAWDASQSYNIKKLKNKSLGHISVL
jgi:hypothetical protein